MRLTLRHGYLPADLDGCLFVAPLRVDAKNIYNAGGGIDAAAPATQVVDALGSYIDPDTGLITPAQANILRIGSGIDKTSRHLGALFEGARTNKCLQSEDFNTTWSKTNSTISVNAAAAPDGILTADKLVEDTATGTHHVFQSISVTSGQKIVISVFAKKSESSEIHLEASGAAAPADTNVFFDLNAGIKGTVAAGVDDSGMDDMGNGWYRCWLVFTADATSAFFFVVLPSSGSETTSYTGDGSSGLYLWGAQCEENVLFPGSYIKTTTVAVTRAADDIDYDNTAEANIKAAAGTIYIACTPEGLMGDVNILDTLTAGTVRGVVLDTSFDFKYRFRAWKAGAGGLIVNSLNPMVRGVTDVVAATFKANEMVIYVDGVPQNTDSSGDAPDFIRTDIFVGQSRGNSNQWVGNLAHLHIYDSAHDAARVLANTNEIKSWLGLVA